MYTEAIEKGIVSVTDSINIRDTITASASMDHLVGAQIGYVWDSGRNMVYAAAYIDKAETVSHYTDMILVNNRNINALTTMSEADKNTFNGIASYRLASGIAAINANYASLITQCGGSVSSLNINSPGFYDLQAAEILRNITVTVNVNNDRANRVHNAFASVLSAQGLRVYSEASSARGNNPPYTIEAFVFTNEALYPNSNFKWCVMEINANLIENSTGASLFPLTLTIREGHLIYANAEARAYQIAEREIAVNFSSALREYLASLRL